MLDMQREIRAVLRNVGRMRHLYTGENVGRYGTRMQVLQALKSSVIEKGRSHQSNVYTKGNSRIFLLGIDWLFEKCWDAKTIS